MFSSQFSEDQ